MKNRIPMKRTMKHTTKHAMKRTMKRTMKHFAIATVLGLGLALTACASDDDDVTPTGTYQDGGGQDSGAGQATPAATPAPTNQPTDTTANVQGAFEPERDLTGFINFAPTKGALANQLAPPAVGEEFAIIHTNFGEIHLRLFPDIAPMAVQNFTTHARNGFYDDLIFHRVMYNFMIQGGCSLGTGTGGQSIWGRGFGDEVTTDLRHIRGALSMANTGAPFSNGSQFFIVHNHTLHASDVSLKQNRLEVQDMRVTDGEGYLDEYLVSDVWPAEWMQHYLDHGGTQHLDYNHTVFGHVFYGMDVVDAIAAVATSDGSTPIDDVVIYRIEIRTRE